MARTGRPIANTELSGSIGGGTYSNTRGSGVLKARVKGRNPRSPNQMNSRGNLAAAAKTAKSFTPDEVTIWKLFAQSIILHNKVSGNPYKPSWMQAYMTIALSERIPIPEMATLPLNPETWRITAGASAFFQVEATTVSTGQSPPFTGDSRVNSVSCEAGTYDLWAEIWIQPNMGIVQFNIDGTDIGTPIDCYANPGGTWTSTKIGTVTLTQGQHLVRRTITGKNGAASSWFHIIGGTWLQQTA